MSQGFAISGGPWGRSGQIAATGNYAAVLIAQSCDVNPAAFQTGRCGANSIGIFSCTVPKSGSATGPLVIFNNGQTYVGAVQVTADPNTAKMNGSLSATFTFEQQVLVSDTIDKDGTETKTFATQSFSASAAGQMNASIKAVTNGFGATGGTRLTGKADVQFSLVVNNIDDDIAYQVRGFKQSELTSQ